MLPQEIVDDSKIMKYAIKGTDSQWKEAINSKNETLKSSSIVQIKNNGHKVIKRKLKGNDGVHENKTNSTEKNRKKKTGYMRLLKTGGGRFKNFIGDGGLEKSSKNGSESESGS